MVIQRTAATATAASLVLACVCSSTQVAAFSHPSFKIRTERANGVHNTRRTQPLAALNGDKDRDVSRPFIDASSPNTKRDLSVRSYVDVQDETIESTNDDAVVEYDQESVNSWRVKLSEMTGKIDEDRLAFPEIASGEVPRVFR